MTYVTRHIVGILVMLSVMNVCSQELIDQSPKLIKSVLTRAGSSTVTYEYSDISGAIRTLGIIVFCFVMEFIYKKTENKNT